ncbi:hypothetical protein USB125703_00278 [Pseudoclavibacter triregionum]|nr:hypothetical protein USB125703_00278 [Pseudoclavibacter triregionum]
MTISADAARSASRSKLDRWLAGVALVSAILALAAFAAVIIATFSGVTGEAWSSPIWVAVFTVAYWGLPLALVAIIALVIRRAVARPAAEPTPEGG